MDVAILSVLILLGLSLGSFSNAVTWRLAMQLSKKRPAKLNLSITKGRSMCTHCHHMLAWYDLIPVISWVFLGGKCRYCQASISIQYPLVELTMTALFVLSYIYWPFLLQSPTQKAIFALWLLILTLLTQLFIYDLRWMLLPNRLIYPLAALAVVFAILEALSSHHLSVLIASVVGSVLIGGFFWLIYQISQGKWIGGGDVRYGFCMGLLLGWQKGLLGLVLSSYLGLLVIVVVVIRGKYHKKMKLPYGPLLIGATFISLLWGQYAIDAYKRLSGL